MGNLFRNFFDTSDFPARWNCGNWEKFHGWLHIGSDLAIWASYFMIPLALGFYWWSKRSELAFPRLFWLFAAFIFCCGTTHLIEAAIFYVPIYRVSGLMKFITAVVSWMTVVAIIRVGRQALELPGQARLSQDLQQQLDRARIAELQLAESNNELLEYTSRVTHDLRSPLSGILLLGDLAAESVRNGQVDQAAKQLESMLGSLRGMDASIMELHRQSMVDKQHRKQVRVSLGKVLQTVISNMSSKIAESEAVVTVGSLPEVMGHSILLGHMFTNLLDNAIKYSKAGRPEIAITAKREAGNEIITFGDNGRGIPAADLERIFEPEFRSANARGEQGSGIGLSLCRSIMKGHHGSIRALPGVPRGAAFELRFPRIDASYS